MTDEEKEAFKAIVSAEADFYQASFLCGLLKHNNRDTIQLHERCALPAIVRLWKVK
jgi:hypothetical protein